MERVHGGGSRIFQNDADAGALTTAVVSGATKAVGGACSAVGGVVCSPFMSMSIPWGLGMEVPQWGPGSKTKVGGMGNEGTRS